MVQRLIGTVICSGNLRTDLGPTDALHDWSQKLFYVASAALQPKRLHLS